MDDKIMRAFVEIDRDAVEKRKIAVYFSNERRAIFDEGEVIFRTGASAPWTKEIEDHGGAIVNWDNVCYVRPVVEDEEP